MQVFQKATGPFCYQRCTAAGKASRQAEQNCLQLKETEQRWTTMAILCNIEGVRNSLVTNPERRLALMAGAASWQAQLLTFVMFLSF